MEVTAKKTITRLCMQCNQRTIGARSKTCSHCGATFPVKSGDIGVTQVITVGSNYPVVSQLPPDYADKNYHTIVVTPNGAAPLPIPSQFKYADIINWVMDVRAAGESTGEFFSRSALLTFGRGVLRGTDFKRFADIINNEIDDPAPFIQSDTVHQDN